MPEDATAPKAPINGAPSSPSAKAAPEAPKLVACEVVSDTPVDRVINGDTVYLEAAIAEQFTALKLVKPAKTA